MRVIGLFIFQRLYPLRLPRRVSSISHASRAVIIALSLSRRDVSRVRVILSEHLGGSRASQGLAKRDRKLVADFDRTVQLHVSARDLTFSWHFISSRRSLRRRAGRIAVGHGADRASIKIKCLDMPIFSPPSSIALVTSSEISARQPRQPWRGTEKREFADERVRLLATSNFKFVDPFGTGEGPSGSLMKVNPGKSFVPPRN